MHSIPLHLPLRATAAVLALTAAGSLHAATSAAAAGKPSAGATAAPSMFEPAASAVPRKPLAPLPPATLIDINSASRSQLKTLPGVGDAEADRIVAGRPYLSKAELVTKNVIQTGPYLSLKDHVVAMQKNKPKAKR